MLYLQLFLSFLQIGAFSFGGGYAAMPLIQEQVVTRYHWLSGNEFTDLVTISQMTPGPIAVNAATFVGIKLAGGFGAIAATAGCVLPSCIIVTLLAGIYTKYKNLSVLQGTLAFLRPAVVAMIAAAGVTILRTAFWEAAKQVVFSEIKIDMVIIFMLAVLLLRKKKANPILVMVLCGVIKLCLYVAGIA